MSYQATPDSAAAAADVSSQAHNVRADAHLIDDDRSFRWHIDEADSKCKGLCHLFLLFSIWLGLYWWLTADQLKTTYGYSQYSCAPSSIYVFDLSPTHHTILIQGVATRSDPDSSLTYNATVDCDEVDASKCYGKYVPNATCWRKNLEFTYGHHTIDWFLLIVAIIWTIAIVGLFVAMIRQCCIRNYYIGQSYKLRAQAMQSRQGMPATVV